MTRTGGSLRLSPVVAVLAILVALFLVVPIVIIGIQSLSSSRYLEFPPPAYSLRWYHALASDHSWRDALVVSLQVASAVTLFATVLGTIGALGIHRQRRKSSKAWLSVLITPVIVPSIVTAVATFLLFSKMNLIETRIGLVLAHTVVALPLVVLSVLSSLHGVNESLEISARTLGAGPIRAFSTVTLPMILPGVLTGGVFAFITSFDELVIAMFITGTRVVTLPKRMWDGIHYEIDPTVSAISTLIVLFTSALVLAVAFLARRISNAQGSEIQKRKVFDIELANLPIEANSRLKLK